MSDYVHVAVGVVVDDNDQVLVARRPIGSHQGGLWEFPGGKVESGESVQQALQRELQEELGIRINPSRCFPVKKIHHHYQDRSVLLDIWMVGDFSGDPVGSEGQEIAWRSIEALQPQSFPAANRAIIELLKLPGQIAVTGPAANLDEFLLKLGQVLDRGLKLVQLRQPGLQSAELHVWAGHAMDLCAKRNAQLLVNTTADVFLDTPAHGLHLNSIELMRFTSRPVAADQILGGSCHNLAELRQAEAIGVDFAVLSPVLPTSSHPQSEPLGWEQFLELAGAVSVPVYALGGMTPACLPQARNHGAHGIASISAYW